MTFKNLVCRPGETRPVSMMLVKYAEVGCLDGLFPRHDDEEPRGEKSLFSACRWWATLVTFREALVNDEENLLSEFFEVRSWFWATWLGRKSFLVCNKLPRSLYTQANIGETLADTHKHSLTIATWIAVPVCNVIQYVLEWNARFYIACSE